MQIYESSNNTYCFLDVEQIVAKEVQETKTLLLELGAPLKCSIPHQTDIQPHPIQLITYGATSVSDVSSWQCLVLGLHFVLFWQSALSQNDSS